MRMARIFKIKILLVLVLDFHFRSRGRRRGRFHLAAGHFFGSIAQPFMNAESFLKQRLLCITSVDRVEDAVPLAETLLAGGLSVMEITFRTAAAAESIQRIRQKVPEMAIGAGTLLLPEQVQRAIDVGAQFGVSPGLNETVLAAMLAVAAGLPRQKVNYHLRTLERHGLIELVGERRKGNMTERLLQAAAASYVISPAALAAVAPDPARSPDRLSARWLLALAR